MASNNTITITVTTDRTTIIIKIITIIWVEINKVDTIAIKDNNLIKVDTTKTKMVPTKLTPDKIKEVIRTRAKITITTNIMVVTCTIKVVNPTTIP